MDIIKAVKACTTDFYIAIFVNDIAKAADISPAKARRALAAAVAAGKLRKTQSFNGQRNRWMNAYMLTK